MAIFGAILAIVKALAPVVLAILANMDKPQAPAPYGTTFTEIHQNVSNLHQNVSNFRHFRQKSTKSISKIALQRHQMASPGQWDGQKYIYYFTFWHGLYMHAKWPNSKSTSKSCTSKLTQNREKHVRIIDI